MALQKDSPIIGEIKTRDWVAVMALQGLIASKGEEWSTNNEQPKKLADVACRFADAMISQSKEQRE